MLAISDLNVTLPENPKVVENMQPESSSDWLLVADAGGELAADLE